MVCPFKEHTQSDDLAIGTLPLHHSLSLIRKRTKHRALWSTLRIVTKLFVRSARPCIPSTSLAPYPCSVLSNGHQTFCASRLHSKGRVSLWVCAPSRHRQHMGNQPHTSTRHGGKLGVECLAPVSIRGAWSQTINKHRLTP